MHHWEIMNDAKVELFGDRLRAVLKARGMTQAALAALSGLTPSEISRYVNNKRLPTEQTLEILAKHLDMPLGELVAGTNVEDRVAPELAFVRREQHEDVVGKFTTAQARIHELEQLVAAKDEQIAELVAEKVEVEDERDALLEANVAALRVAEDRATAIAETKGQLVESREHVFQLEQTVQGQAAKIRSLEIVQKGLVANLSQAQSQYNALKASYDWVWSEYTDLYKKHHALPAPSSDPTPMLIAGLFGFGLGMLGGAAAASD
jgi:transcriptional regulator with XRE-family HTH domain